MGKITRQELSPNLNKELDGFNEQLVQAESKLNVAGVKSASLDPIDKGITVFVTDDAALQDYTTFKDIFSNAGVPCCTAVIPIRVGTNNYTTVEQLLELQNNYGWEILSHTYSHLDLTQLTDSELEYELRESKEWLINKGFKIENFAYPFGRYNDRVKQFAKKYYRSARSSDFGRIGINPTPLDTYALNSLWIDASVKLPPYKGLEINTFEYYKYFIDKAKAEKKLLVISFHSWGTESEGLLEVFKQVVQYAKENTEVLTMSEALDRIGNVLEVGDTKQTRFAIGKDGAMIGYNFAGNNTYNGNNMVTDFPDYTTTINTVTKHNAVESGLPSGQAGTLITYKYGGDSISRRFDFQLYIPLPFNDIYMRGIKENEVSWTNWEKLNYLNTKELNSYTIGNDITMFDRGITVNNISNAMASQAPEGKAGVLITHKHNDTEHGYNWQEYHVYGSDNVYKRLVDINGLWMEWKRINPTSIESVNSKTPSTPISEYPLGITINNVQTTHSSGAPENLGGTLKTYKLSDSEYGYNWQEYRIFGTSRIYRRLQDSNGDWGSWIPTSSFFDENKDFKTPADPIEDFPFGVTTYRISGSVAKATGAPENAGGTFITHKYDTVELGYNWQEYHIYGTSKVYKRSFNEDGTPKAWEKISTI